MTKSDRKGPIKLGWERGVFAGRRVDYADQEALMKPDGIHALTDWFIHREVDEGDAKLLAECLTCEYLHNIHRPLVELRNSAFKKDLVDIKKAAEFFQQVLKTSHGETKKRLLSRLFMRKEPEGGRRPGCLYASLPQTERSAAATNLLDPITITALGDIAIVAEELISTTRVDKGGKASGRFDPTCRHAKEALVLQIRWTLRCLGLNINSNKGCEVSQLISLIHAAATGETASWADKYAAKSSRLEAPRFIFREE